VNGDGFPLRMNQAPVGMFRMERPIQDDEQGWKAGEGNHCSLNIEAEMLISRINGKI
jgi:hypothetical protein